MCCLRGALLRIITSACSYKIMLFIWYVVLIIHVDNIRTRVIQSRRGTPTPKISLRLQQEIDRGECPPMYTRKWFKHNCRSSWMPIFEWIIRTHLAYHNPNGAIIYLREASWPRILVLRSTTCIDDAQSSTWPTRPQTDDTI